jgi:hypothetical protein
MLVHRSGRVGFRGDVSGMAVDPQLLKTQTSLFLQLQLYINHTGVGALCGAVFSCVDAPMPTFLRLVQGDDNVPLLLTLCDEHGNEIDSATAPSGDAAIRSAIMLLS